MSKIQNTPRELQATTEMALFFEKMKARLDVAPVADLNQTIAGPSIAEVQAISDKVDELMAAMRVNGLLET